MPSSTSLVVLLMFVAVSVAQRHNLIDCHSQIGDRLLAEKSAARSYNFLSRVSATVHVDVRGNTIHCVEAIDQWDDDTGGYAEITEGGIGYDRVKVKITSQFSRGFWFVIKVYGQ
jgi:hypothetical protein